LEKQRTDLIAVAGGGAAAETVPKDNTLVCQIHIDSEL
jgi:hypothetical protein